MTRRWLQVLAITVPGLLAGMPVARAAETVYQSPAAFLEEYLPGCAPKVAWLKAGDKAEIEALLERTYAGLRARYCEKEGKTAWILDEIGKVEPITTGVVIDHGQVERVRVLIYRESRGAEVRRDAFTRQFDQARLGDDNDLDRHIDGITGATLSVHALGRQVSLALLLDRIVRGAPDAS